LPNIGSLSMLGREETGNDDSASPAHCTVEIRSTTRRAKEIEVPLAADSRVQDVLDASQASTKFRHLDVYILRPTQHPTEPALKMVCPFDRKNRRISWQSDYAVLPGDRIVVSEARVNPMEQMLGGLIGGL
jgi:hypothetical protein